MTQGSLRQKMPKDWHIVLLFFVTAATYAMLCTVTLVPLFSIKVEPLLQPPQNSYTWRVNDGCVGINATTDHEYLSQRIDFTPYVRGCGSYGDGVDNKATTSSETDGNTWVFLTLGLAIGLPFAFSCLILLVACCGHDWKEEKIVPLRLAGCIWLILYCGSLLITGIYLYQAVHVFAPTWLCRPYGIDINAYGQISAVYVVNTSPDRGSVMIESPPEWDMIEDISTRCANINKHYGKRARWFSIPFEASEEVQTAIQSKLDQAKFNYGMYTGCVSIPFCLGLIWFMMLTDEQQARIQTAARSCLFPPSRVPPHNHVAVQIDVTMRVIPKAE